MRRPAWIRRRVPFRQQLTPTECAAACLAMVLTTHGHDTGVSECRERLGPGRDGTSLPHLVEAAREYGLRAEIDQSADPFARPQAGPAIAYLSERHFVVVERADRRWVRIVDPGAGRQRLERAEFDRRYGGVLVRFATGPDFVPYRVPFGRTVLARYLRQFVAVPGGRRLLAGVVLVAALLKGLGLALPLATQVVVDRLIPTHRDDLLPVLGIAVLGIAALHGLLTLVRARLLLVLRARADALLTGRFVGHLLHLPLSFFLQRSRGDLLMRAGSVSATREQLTQQVLTLILDAALLSGYVVGLALIAPGYVLVVAVLGAIQVLVLLSTYRRLRTLAQRELLAKSEEQSYLVEALEAMVPVKANGMEQRIQAHWADLFENYRGATLRRGAFSARTEAVQSALTIVAPLGLLWFGVWLVLDGQMTLGAMLAANAVAMSVLSPLQTFVGATQLFSMLRGQIERIFDVLDSATEPVGRKVLAGTAPVGIEIDEVTFRYHPEAKPVLDAVTLTVPRGGKIGIVGRTGSGKSTLAMLVLGLLPVEVGTVHHDGVDVRELDLHQLRAGYGAVLQQLSLFNGSIRDNLTLGQPDASDDDVEYAARIAGLHADVLMLPMGYQTLVGEGGAALSAGQRQRVALARALIHRPRLLILDEATSHLDPQTERRVDEALSRLEVTRIVISHRLSAVRNADQIAVLDGGRLVALGRHEELIAERGIYQDLFGTATNGSAPRLQAAVHGVPALNG